MYLATTLNSLKEKVSSLEDKGIHGKIVYGFTGRITFDMAEGKETLIFEGGADYKTDFETYPPNSNTKRALSFGKLKFAHWKKKILEKERVQ